MVELSLLKDNWLTYMLILNEVNMTSIVIEMHDYIMINDVLLVYIIVTIGG